jgi:hypothetical protein
MYSGGVLFLIRTNEMEHLQAIRFPQLNRAECFDDLYIYEEKILTNKLNLFFFEFYQFKEL